MDFRDFLSALSSLWPLQSAMGEFPLLLQVDTNPVVIPGSGQTTASVTLPGDCDIEIDDWTYWSSDAKFPDESGFRVAIFYGSGDYALNYPANNQVRGEQFFGTAQRPGRIGYRPWRIATYGNRGLLSFNFSNINTTTTTVEICLRGHRSKPQGA